MHLLRNSRELSRPTFHFLEMFLLDGHRFTAASSMSPTLSIVKCADTPYKFDGKVNRTHG